MRVRRWSTMGVVIAVMLAATVSYGKDAAPVSKPACEKPCAHVDDCPKVTCQCDQGSGTDVAVCDTEKTHCCFGPDDACKKFCSANHQIWTGRFGAGTPSDSASQKDDKPAAPASSCAHTCKEPGDCPTVTCQCKKAKAPNVAACDVQTKCCGDASVVCEHYCKEQKDQWTGKATADKAVAPHDDALGDADPEDDDDGPVLEDPDIDVE